MIRPLCLAALCSLLLAAPAPAQEDAFINLEPGATPAYEPGALVLLPDGRRAVIDAYLPNGRLKTDIGIVLTPQGVIAEGPGQGEKVAMLAPGQPATPAQPGRERAAIPGKQAPQAGKAPATEPRESARVPVRETAPEAKPADEHYYSLAELLPMTEVPSQKSAPEKNVEATPKTEAEKKPKAEEKPKEKPKAQEKQARPDKPKEGKKPEPPKAEKPGQELRIPPQAAKTGNLDFLEGCWQGIRPEYYSKRNIRECFCFGKNGKNGKRRVHDPRGGRQCIGASRASLSKEGVLTVTSSGAACNDGERWGQAEMICRNSGPRTPCSWVFRDANNGRQAYEIPFTRVESCGR